MANNYTQFSFMLARDASLTDEEIEQFMSRCGVNPECWGCDKCQKAATAIREDDCDALDALCADCDKHGDVNWCDFAAEKENDNIWINSGDESGDIEAAAAAAKWFVENVRNDLIVVGSYAAYCSKLRLDEFGGGGFLVASGLEKWCGAMDVFSLANALKGRTEDQ